MQNSHKFCKQREHQRLNFIFNDFLSRLTNDIPPNCYSGIAEVRTTHVFHKLCVNFYLWWLYKMINNTNVGER